MWDLYDHLLETTTPGKAQKVLAGLWWTAVQGETLGLALSVPRSGKETTLAGALQGRELRDLAGLIKSWNFTEAAIGLAAINSCLNTPKAVEQLSGKGLTQLPDISAFDFILDLSRGKKVGIIGHFPHMEQLRQNTILTVFERQPHDGDLPDTALEYLLPEQDVVLITASTLINKTMPRLLELSRKAVTVLLGPSTPLSPVMFDFGVDILGGLVVENPELVWRCLAEGGGFRSFRPAARCVNIARKGLTL
ncbi:MAG: DUF364 domain-containing protein [Heliobacteriaceae bacterium]|nr:DUF364 domain-containing protein [Heliobacteriaceae bacterium]